MADRTENDAVIELATSARVQPLAVEELLHSVVLPPGHTHQVVDLERYRTNPERKREHVALHTSSALSAYVNRHKVDETTTLYADVAQATIVAVLNDSAAAPTEPGWGDHRATLVLGKTDAWKLWEKRDGKIESQVLFAEHIEAGLNEIVDPPAADMLELAQTFEANQSLTLRAAHRLGNGQRHLVWEEQTQAKAGQRGEITIPGEFTLRLQPYEGSEMLDLVARLRYRIRDSLQIGYVLVRPADILREAFTSALEAIEKETGISAFLGTPPIWP